MTADALRQETPSIHEQYADIKQLVEACTNGDIAAVTNLLQKHPDVLDSPDHDTRFPYPESCLWSPLGKAAYSGHERLVSVLLDMGANPVPFEVAAQYHDYTYTDWTDELRERGYNAIADRIETAIAERYGTLVDDANLHQAVLDGDIERARALIAENPARVKQVDRVGNTALHWAVAKNNMAMVRLLLERGAPVNAQNGNGRTPSVVALFGFHRWWRTEVKPEVLQLLRQHGAAYTILIAATVDDVEGVQAGLVAGRDDMAERQFLRPAAVEERKSDPPALRHHGDAAFGAPFGNQRHREILQHRTEGRAERRLHVGEALGVRPAHRHVVAARDLAQALLARGARLAPVLGEPG